MKNYRLKFRITLTFCIVILIFAFSILHLAKALTNISSTVSEHYGWNDTIGWIDFYSTASVNVFSDRLEGYANSQVGYIQLNCATPPPGGSNSCSLGDWKVLNDGNGNLSGWAWNDIIGWISFDSATAGSPYFYQTQINSITGEFSGWVWNDAVGWISFNCNNSGIGNACGSSDYKVKTAWNSVPMDGYLTSSVFSAVLSNGASVNTIIWRGSQPAGTYVKFQIASSNNTSGPWSYIGPDGSSGTYYSAGPSISIPINLNYHNNQKYLRYRVYLYSDPSKTLTPEVEDVIINYSP